MNWKPNRLQEAWLRNGNVVATFAGPRASGKSEALIVAALRLIEHPTYSALLVAPGVCFDESVERLFSALGGKRDPPPRGRWGFPSGARIEVISGHATEELFFYRVAGAGFHFVGVDDEPAWLRPHRSMLISRVRQLGHPELPLRFRVCVHENEPELTIKISIPKEDPPTPPWEPCSCCVGLCGRP